MTNDQRARFETVMEYLSQLRAKAWPRIPVDGGRQLDRIDAVAMRYVLSFEEDHDR